MRCLIVRSIISFRGKTGIFDIYGSFTTLFHTIRDLPTLRPCTCRNFHTTMEAEFRISVHSGRTHRWKQAYEARCRNEPYTERNNVSPSPYGDVGTVIKNEKLSPLHLFTTPAPGRSFFITYCTRLVIPDSIGNLYK